MKELDRYRGCLLGLAVGDAIGTAVEFKARGSFPPVTDMLGGGAFNLIQDATNSTVMATEEGTKEVDGGMQLVARARRLEHERRARSR